MKLTDELKKKIDDAATEEEVKEILSDTKKDVEQAGLILEDAELDRVAGGMGEDVIEGGWSPRQRW